MGGRYLITGADIGTIKGLLQNEQIDSALKEIERIFDKNFLGNSERHIKEDVKKLTKCLEL